MAWETGEAKSEHVTATSQGYSHPSTPSSLGQARGKVSLKSDIARGIVSLRLFPVADPCFKSHDIQSLSQDIKNACLKIKLLHIVTQPFQSLI